MSTEDLSDEKQQQIAGVIREYLGLDDFKGDQLFEGTIDADELAAVIAASLT